MAAASDAVWAIDLGNNSLKALHLVAVGEAVQVIGFDHIPHGKILTSGVSAAEREELIAITLRQFVQRNDVGFDPVIISVSSQNSFARFVTLPPVEAKRLPEIVKFEAAQQIPFDMSEIQWDWQLMSDPDSPEKKVGLFAIKNEIVNAALESFEREELPVSFVQMAPMALYNYLLFDRPDLANSDKRATVIVNIGAESTDLVVCTASGVWQRCITTGGNAFTNAIAETFKLSFEKAEKLKRTAPVSKYARQIFQAMRPVFTDWSGEVQRSLGFYTSSNPDVKITRVIAMGGGTKLRGLVKYLSQTLQLPVEKPDAFQRLAVAPGVSTAKFHENVSDFGVVYGLGLQGLGMARIESNLLPSSIARSQAWAGKMKYFIGAAVMLLVVSLACLGRVGLDHASYAKGSDTRAKITRVVSEAKRATASLGGVQDREGTYKERMKKSFEWFRYREVVPQLHEIIVSALPGARTNPERKDLYEAFARGDVAQVKQTPRPDRKQLFLTTLAIFYSDDLAKAQFRASAAMRRDAMMQEMDMMDESEGYDPETMKQLEQMYGAQYMQEMLGGTTATQKAPGFVITVEGYSPYKNIGDLLDPPNVRDTPAKWGFVTRLENLKQFLNLDVNSPFEMYDKGAANFKLDKGPVDLELEIPQGVGQWHFIPDPPVPGAAPAVATYAMGMGPQGGTWILIDPMTKEPISADPVKDQHGNLAYDATGKTRKTVRDFWFRLQFKLVWKEAPASAAPAAGGMMPGMRL
ncbi:MAG: type IV pilus assembly protein PilM [Planctomycetes bacterium]|nr:type IV pilus assembly protein PilM [Planctomycetota bacterium]